MLEIRNVTKTYHVGDFSQKALDDVSVNFRKCEFASILGPSGSGKTTLLNIIGGLDRYDSGDLIINETSTKKYKDRDWDSYRNHRVGFVFQNYNLISHQNILRNVELALTLSGVSKKERKEKAKNALEKVGLIDHIYKRPNQLSGGQMQRVAIARALVNDPEILLADEPTGALDTQTSMQIMDILSDVAKDRLVIMVTHNPDLAENYSTRIINLLDGHITSDSNPYDGSMDTKIDLELTKKKTKKTSMSFITALGLSLNNLMTKKGRTILTAFAGSIGIIGIALILSLSSGVNEYITNIQKETMLSYPISISAKEMDLSSFLQQGRDASEGKNKTEHEKNAVYSDGTLFEMAQSMNNNIYDNNLKKFKKYLDDKDSEIHKYVGDGGIVYSYTTPFKVYSYDPDGVLVNSDGSTFEKAVSNEYASISEYMNTSIVNNMFSELLPKKDGTGINDAVKSEYELIKGEWPSKYDEVVIILDKNNEISATNLYYLGMLPSKKYKDLLKEVYENKDFKYDIEKIEYEDILKKEFKLVLGSDFFVKKENGLYQSFEDDSGKVEEFVKNKSLTLKVVGIIRQNEESKNRLVNASVGYSSDLTNWMIQKAGESEAVKAQLKSEEKSVVTGLKFKIATDDEKAEQAKIFIKNLSVSEKAKMATLMLQQTNNPMASKLIQSDEATLAKIVDQNIPNMKKQDLIELYNNYVTPETYENVLKTLGYVDKESPSTINIYVDTFEDKDGVTKSIDNYNEKQKEEDKIKYNDLVGLLMSEITVIINAITYVLIAFVSISLVVSSIMIAIITYISVLERIKEIGILRSIGASKKDVTRVFKAETFIEGFVAGLFGVLVTVILCVPINIIIKSVADVDLYAALPVVGGIVLIAISVGLTVLAGLIPSRLAAKKDPVEALRSE